MNKKQQVAIISLPILTLTMVIVYRIFARLFGRKTAWYLGFLVYWPVWCIAFPLKLLGSKKLKALFKWERPNLFGWFMLLFPPMMAFLGRFVLDKKPRQPKEKFVLVLMAFLNGILEEVLWRGVYIELFPNKLLWGNIWPTVWFALWHYAPGSVSPLANVWVLMTGAGVLGASLSWLTKQTRSISLAVTSHTVSGLVQSLS
jgi:membrane protease YdiL (CAAX protease family)